MEQYSIKKTVTLFSLIMLITGSIDSIRNLPVTALFGSEVVFFFIVGAIVFLVPTALVSAQLSVLFPEKGGIFQWVLQAFGERTAMLAIWLQWINTMVWFPTILLFIAGTLAYLIDPALGSQRGYLLTVVLVVFWAVTFINMRGIQASARLASVCAVIGLIIPFILIIVLGMIWLYKGYPIHISFAHLAWVPHFSGHGHWSSLTGVITAFLGMELATVYIGQIKKANKLFPPALAISVFLIVIIMVFGALTIAFVLPSDKISLISGVMETFSQFFAVYHMGWVLPIITLMILIGSLGGLVNWLISPAKGLREAAQHGFLPKALTVENKKGVASRMLLMQGVVVSVICMSMQLMPTVNGSYWLLTDLSTQLYLLMYLVMFLAALVISGQKHLSSSLFSLCAGRWGLRFICGLGLLGCMLSLIVGFIPPQDIEVGGALHFETMFISGLIVMILPVFFLWWYRSLKNKPSFK